MSAQVPAQYYAGEEPLSATYTVTAAVGTTAAIAYRNMRGGMVYVGAASGLNAVVLTFHASDDDRDGAGTYYALKDKNNNAVTRTAASSSCFPVPDECFGCDAFKMVRGSGSDDDVIISAKG